MPTTPSSEPLPSATPTLSPIANTSQPSRRSPLTSPQTRLPSSTSPVSPESSDPRRTPRSSTIGNNSDNYGQTRPRQYVMVVLKGSVPMAFGGTQDPTAYGELVSIGGLSPAVNKKLSAGIASILESKLSVPKSRFYLKFNDTKGSDFGWNGSTF